MVKQKDKRKSVSTMQAVHYFFKKHAVRVAESRATVKHQRCNTRKVVLRKNRHIGDSAKKL